jgi:glutaredoxin
MEIEIPASKDFTIYSKSGCNICRELKDYLKLHKQPYITVNCDDYLLEDRLFFLSFMKNYTNCDLRTFPIVFFNGEYIGGFKETKIYIDKLVSFNYEV